MPAGKLIIARHHESEWNKKGLWTGSRDIHLTDYGFIKSHEMGLLIKDIHVDHAFASTQVRSLETLTAMLEDMQQATVPIERSSAINERDYGDYTGKNKWEIKEKFGEETFNCMRRDWDCAIKNGETLKMVYERTIPFYLEKIVPLVQQGKNVLVVSHGNTIRALMKYMEHISDEDIKNIEMLFGSVVVYDIDKDGYMINKEIRQIESQVDA